MASAVDKNFNARFLDAGDEPNQFLLPIDGYAKEPLLLLEEAVQPINDLLDDLDAIVDIAKRNSKKPADGLTSDESAAIYLYTMQWEDPSVSICTMLNSTLRSERRELIRPWFRYLKLILTALYKLPSLKSTVWRGVRGNLSDQYNDDVVWWGFSSCMESMEAIEQFIGKSEVRTLFTIECINGKVIQAHSFFKKESEILLLPGSYFRVVGKWNLAKELYIIHLRETLAPRPYLEPPFNSISLDTSASAASSSNIETQAIQNLAISKGLLINIPSNARWKQNGITVAGGNGQGNAFNQFNCPFGLYVDDDQSVYVADYRNDRIVKWESGATNGKVVAGGNGEGNRIDQMNGPTDVIVDKEADSLIICDDYGNRRVTRWSLRNGRTSGEIIIENIECRGLTMDYEKFLYVADDLKHEVRRYRMGETQGIVVAGGNGQGDRLNQLSVPAYIFVDRDQSVYVSDCNNDRVMKWMKDEKEGIVVAGGQGEGNALTQLDGPRGVFVDQLGTVYVADTWNNRVMRWVKGMTQGDVIIGENGRGDQANQLSVPEGLSFDRHGNLYVVDTGNDRVQRFSIE